MFTATPVENDLRAVDAKATKPNRGPTDPASVVRHGQWIRRALVPLPPPPLNPALLKHAEERAGHFQSRIADKITAFAGSMAFVYLHVIWLGLWIGFGVENYPFGLLTMIVSLEAIFLSTFVMISQNRADSKHQVIADEEWRTVQHENHQNDELLDVSKQILELTTQLHAAVPKAAVETDSRNLASV
jgi:Protein of unknown function (DUF1003)